MKGKKIQNSIREKIIEVEEKNNIELSTVQKILCATEGPIVTILDVLYGDVNLFILDQHIEKANEEIAEKLQINEGEEIDYREAIISKYGRPLSYALSLIPKERCSDEIIEKLLKEDKTTGKIILEHEIEKVNIVDEIYLEKPDDTLQSLFHTSEGFLARESVLIHNKHIVLWCKECYPISHFKE